MRARWRGYAWSHPEWWLPVTSAGAWMALVALFVFSALSPARRADHAGHLGGYTGTSFTTALAWWMLMIAAMMLPLISKQARWLAFRSLRRRRHATVALFAGAYLLVWVAVGALVIGLVEQLYGDLLVVTTALGVAACWHVAPVRRRLLRRCGASRAPTVTGWKWWADCIRSGVRAGTRCVGTCWALMIPMGIVHHPALMLGATLALVGERAPGPNPERRAGRALEALCVAGAALALLLVSAS